MSNLIRQPFTPGGKFVAFKSFRFHGRKYVKGDDFPWRQLSCSVRQLRKLYEGRFLNNEYVDPDADPSIKAEEPVVEEEVTEETAESYPHDDLDEEQSTEVELVYDPEVHEIINPDRGEWYMADVEGTRLLRLTAKAAKSLRKKSEPSDIDPEAVIEE